MNGETEREGSISYGALIVAAVAMVHSLRQRLGDIAIPPSAKQEVGVCIVVAIPEGFLLPLAILVVHLLNEPTKVDSEASTMFAVLVPLEPGEGKERLRHMLVDVRPAMILSLSGKDSKRLEEIIGSIEPMNASSLTKEGLCPASRPTLVDFGELLRDVIAASSIKDEPFSVIEKVRDHFSDCNDQQGFLQALSVFERCTRDYETPAKRLENENRISHIVFTSGTTGRPKGCISSIKALCHYIRVKNEAHEITAESKVLLASSLSFDPCLSDVLATFYARATLVIASRPDLIQNMAFIIKQLDVTHILCTPTMWGMVHGSGVRPIDFPSLQVVALGGEPIPKHITNTWARKNSKIEDIVSSSRLRLCSTYGVTEACVYQTFGEVWASDQGIGQNVGKPLRALDVHICYENNQTSLEGVKEGTPGEIVLSGKQLDECSGYLSRGQPTADKFGNGSLLESDNDIQYESYYYRTGDRGYVDSFTGDIHILGRIEGEDGMVKINGVRVELGEIESALIDNILIADCLALDKDLENGSKQIHVFCVLTHQGLFELELNRAVDSAPGILLTSGTLLLLLRLRCKELVRAGVMPSKFIVIKRLPLSPTGKRDRRRLPHLIDCISSDSLNVSAGDSSALPLREYGSSGAIVADHVVRCLNLQPCQQSLLTTTTSFGALGGDSLAATRLVRSLYAYHNGVNDSRRLGGPYGVLEGPFAVSHLLQTKSMGEYVDWLDSHGVCDSTLETTTSEKESANGHDTIAEEGKPTIAGEGKPKNFKDKSKSNDNIAGTESSELHQMYEALLEAIMFGHSLIACSLLDVVDPNMYKHSGRLGKTSGIERRQAFLSNPLHLACAKGDPLIVKKLLEKDCNFKSPDASGSFPIHLAASSTENSHNDLNEIKRKEEDERRCECVRLLLEAGAPLTMKDGSKQSVLHSAARAGHCKLLSYLMQCWSGLDDKKKVKSKHKAGPYDWNDRWFRTPVHWAVLNGNVQALEILLNGGCSANPYTPKSNRQTSVAMESPLEICDRVYGNTDKGIAMRDLLLAAKSSS
jgi:acyl-CoA synthetase (AMP-forming)/AMP-acid ligase II/ankyrin repeat protein